MGRIIKKVKPYISKNVKCVQFFDKNILNESDDIFRFLLVKYERVLICYNKFTLKSDQFSSMDNKEK